MTHYATFDSWTYETFEPTTPSSELGPFDTFVDIWRGKAKNGALPSWKDFDFTDFDGWIGRIIVEELVSEDPIDVRYLLWGTTVTEIFQYEMTGKLMSEAPPNQFDPVEFELIDKMRKDKVFVLAKGPINWTGRDYKMVAVFGLPLASDGQTVDRILRAVCDLSKR